MNTFNLNTIGDILLNIKEEQLSSNKVLHMTANENVMSKTAEHFMNSNLSYRYHAGTYDEQEGLLKSRFYKVNNALMLRCLPSVFALEEQARICANELFHASFCDFRLLSGMSAVVCMITTITQPGDCVYVFTKESVAHNATVNLLNSLGRKVYFIPWNFKEVTIDLDQLAKQVKKNPPHTVLFDYGTPFYPLPIKEVREIVGNEVIMIYDASHVLGLIAGGQFQNPLEEGCDIIIGNTHKTFPGPQKGVHLYKDEKLGRRIFEQLFKSVLSAQHTHHTIALYITMVEMMLYGKDYAAQIVKNNHALSKALLSHGFKIFSRDKELPLSHMLAIIGGFPTDNHDACAALHESCIITNSRKLFDIPAVRLGVQEPTRRGMKESDMQQIADFYKSIIIDGKNMTLEVQEFISKFNKISYSIDPFFEKII
jgi:glycine/serine hydroxymethyltransferase